MTKNQNRKDLFLPDTMKKLLNCCVSSAKTTEIRTKRHLFIYWIMPLFVTMLKSNIEKERHEFLLNIPEHTIWLGKELFVKSHNQ